VTKPGGAGVLLRAVDCGVCLAQASDACREPTLVVIPIIVVIISTVVIVRTIIVTGSVVIVAAAVVIAGSVIVASAIVVTDSVIVACAVIVTSAVTVSADSVIISGAIVATRSVIVEPIVVIESVVVTVVVEIIVVVIVVIGATIVIVIVVIVIEDAVVIIIVVVIVADAIIVGIVIIAAVVVVVTIVVVDPAAIIVAKGEAGDKDGGVGGAGVGRVRGQDSDAVDLVIIVVAQEVDDEGAVGVAHAADMAVRDDLVIELAELDDDHMIVPGQFIEAIGDLRGVGILRAAAIVRSDRGAIRRDQLVEGGDIVAEILDRAGVNRDRPWSRVPGPDEGAAIVVIVIVLVDERGEVGRGCRRRHHRCDRGAAERQRERRCESKAKIRQS
jgi:hypothetical protein